MGKSKCLFAGRAIGLAVFVFIATPANAQLVLGQGGLTVYDKTNNITWLADFNLPATNRFGLPVCNATNDRKSCINASGSMSYQAATAWGAAMNVTKYLGHSDWQLPTTPANQGGNCSFTGTFGNSFGFNCSAGALGWLYYNALGLTAPNTVVPIPPYTIGPFSNIQPMYYWSQTPGQIGSIGYATFSFNTGFQDANTSPNFMYVLPMIPGKIPGTPAVTGTGLQVTPGGQTVYEPVTNVTWAANANLAATNTFGLPACKDPGTPKICVNQDGAMNWNSATQFIANMNAASYLGQTNWQLPPVDPTCPNYGCVGSLNPMGNLYYNQLGFTQGTPVVATPNIAVGPFYHVQPYIYWSCLGPTIQSACESTPAAPGFEWSVYFSNGFLGTDVFADDYYVTAYYVGPPSGLSCTYSLGSGGQSFPAQGGNGSTTILTSPGCPWVIGPVPTGVTLTSPASGTGPATVNFTVSPNSGSDLTETFTVAGITFTIDQETLHINGLSFIGSMPHLAAEGGWLTTFTFVNKGTSSAIARTSLDAPDGSALTLPINLPQQTQLAGSILASSLDQTIAPNASFVMQATGPANVPYVEGSAQLAANGAIDGFAIFHFNPSNQEAVVPMETRNAASYILPFDNTNGVLTGVALENVSTSGAMIPVVIRDDTGKPLLNSSLILNGSGHTSFVLSDPKTGGFAQTANIRGTIEFDTPGFGTPNAGQISVLGIRYTPPGTLTTIPALANVTNAGGAMAHLAINDGWQTTFVLVNTGQSAASATLKFFADNGNALSLPLTFPQGGSATSMATFTQSIPANASLWVQSAGSANAALQTGSAQLTTTGNVGGFVIFRYNTNGQEAVVPLESRGASSYIIPFDNTNGAATGVAISNASSQGVNIPLTLRDGNGNVLGTSSIALNANGHTSFVLGLQYPSTTGLLGTADFATPSGATISVLGIRSPPALTFTTLPALAK